MRSNVRGALVFFLVLLGCGAGYAQTSLETGLVPYGTYQAGDIDQVNIGSGGVHVHLPLVSYPQRGDALKLSLSITGNTPVWFVHYDAADEGYWETSTSSAGQGGCLSMCITDDQFVTQTSVIVSGNCKHGDPTELVSLSVQEADGYSHVIPGDLRDGCGGDPVRTSYTVDGSGYVASSNGLDPVTIVDRKGITYTVTSGSTGMREDTNGNEINGALYYNTSYQQVTAGYTDTLGRSIPAISTTTNYAGCTGSLPTVSATTWALPGPTGGTTTFKFCYASVSYSTSFGVEYVTEFSGGSFPMLQSVVLPNNQAYTFKYGDGYLDLTQLTLPTGGTIQYSYQNVTLPPPCTVYNECSTLVSRRIASRTVNDETGSHTWTYEYVMTSDYNEGVTVIDPLGDQSIYTIVDDFENGWRETQRLIYQSSSPLLDTVQTEWGDSYGNTCYSTETPTGPCFPTQITTIWPNGKQKQVQKSYDQGGSGFRSFGDVISESEYDYGSGAPGALLRTTTYSYLALTNSTYAANHLFDLQSQVAVFAGASGSGACGSNSAVACTAYAYDGYPLASSGITTQHSSSPPAGTYRGNQTSVSHWLNTNNTLLATTKTYFDTGTVDTVTDPLLNVTTYTYSNTFQGAYVTETQLPNTNVGGTDKNAPNPTTHITQDWYDFNTGLKDWHEDENDQKTSYTYETMWRVATITPPSPEGVTQFTYTDTPGSLSIEQSQVINSTQSTNSYTLFDGLGRQISRVTANGETTPYDRSDTCYDARGWKSFASYPYQTGTWNTWSVCPSSVAGDTYAYDALQRVTSITHSDSTVLTKSYTGAATSVTDEGNGTRGVHHILQVDGLARLKSVCEVTSGTLSVGTDKTPIACSQDIAGTGFLTTYGYDSLGDLLSVSQGSSLNPRTFTYDSLSRLITTTNPEAGTTCYGSWVSGSCVENYDANSNVLSRTRPAPNQYSSTTYVTATYAYDPLNRLTSKTYSDGTTPTATFDYDETGVNSNTLTNTAGRLSSEYTGPSKAVTSESILSYNAPGSTVEDIQCTPQNCANGTYLTFNYGYDGVGDVTSSGNGIIFTYALQYNVVPRLTQITTNWFSPTVSSGTVISGLHYNSFGKPVAASLNDSIVAETWSYDVRGRIKSDTALASSTTLYSLTNLTYSGNSDVLTATDSVNGTWSNYTYDDFNRLISSTCSSTCPQGTANVAFSYTYDRYGNRWQQTLTAGSGSWPQPSYSFDANNRISTSDGFTFDAAGNIINDTIHTYTYDAENRIVQVDAGSTAVYSYDAEGRRVAKTAASAGGAFEYLFDLQGRAVTELGAGTKNINRTEIYGGGRHLATQNVGLSTTYFAHNDWLGTERVRSSLSGTVAETCQSLPYGDVLNCSGAQASTLHFTGQMRDAETNLTEFPARYYSWTQGRFISPDWSPEPDNIPYADTEKPQSLDLYSYVGNNPLRKIDPDGHCCLAEEEATESGAEIGAEIGTLIEPGGGSAVGAFVGGAIGLGVAIYADYKFTHFMMAQHGKQNISNEYSNYTDDELDEAYKNAKSASEKEKIKAEQKSRQQRRSRQSGGKKPKAPTVKNDPASLRAKETPNTTKTTVATPVPANPEKATVTTTHKETLPSPPPPPRD